MKIKKQLGLLISFTFTIILSGCFNNTFTKNLPSKNIEINKYLGVWYEIARLPNWFEKDLVGVTATYSLKDNGEIRVLNQGYIKNLEGNHKKAIGNAWVPDKKKPGRLKVSFFGPFSADYIVIAIDDDYQYALVGSNEDYLWILSRTPILNTEIYQDLVGKAKTLGFNTNKLIKVPQKTK